MSATYTPEWFAASRSRTRNSADALLAHVFDLVQPGSVIDVGCGTGTWLAAAQDLGVTDILGVDGEWAVDAGLEIHRGYFTPTDLDTPSLRFPSRRRFDLALCLEVGEHLRPEVAEPLVGALTAAAPAVLFSAALPGQGGHGHVNEQWPDYWASLFAERGYEFVDCVRPVFWDDGRVRYFYAQNAFLYVEDGSGFETGPRMPMRCVHPALYEAARRSFPARGAASVSGLVRFFGRGLLRR